MARREELLELLRPPAHRGPLIAAGAVLFTTGIALEEQRLDDALPNGVHVLIVCATAALILGLGLQAQLEGGRPAAYQSVLLVSGLLALELALLELADLLGADFQGSDLPAGAFVWTSLLLFGAALYPAVRRNSAICAMIAAIALGVAILAAANWILGADSQTFYRWLLLVLSLAFVLASLVLRGGNPRHAELMVIVAGLATLAIVLVASTGALLGAVVGFDGTQSEGFLPGFWEFIVLGAGCGLIAYGAVDHVPGAAWLGLAHLVGFIAAASAGADDTLLWWPLVLLALGGTVLVVGLRPRRPLPPEPAGYSIDRPLASRTDEEISVRVRNDDPPGR
jgi:peptidoglycan/LPS O-acetylase OafA/YrhL